MDNQPRILFLERRNAISILNLYLKLKTDMPNFEFSLLKLNCLATEKRLLRYAFFIPSLFSDTLAIMLITIVKKPGILVINFPDPTYFNIKILQFFIKFINIKIVKVNHELQSSLSPRLMRQNRFLNDISDTQIFVSESAKIDYETTELPCKRGIVIRNPVSTSGTTSMVAKRKYQCVFASRLDDNKGADLALSWFHQIYVYDNRYRMLFVGSGALHRILKKRARTLGLTEVVEFQPALPRDQLHDLIRESQVLFAPSKYESFNVTLGEALLLGCKVVASDIPAHNEFKPLVSSGLFVVPRCLNLPRSVLEIASDPNSKVNTKESEITGAGYATTYKNIFTELFHENR
jgi:glycosyltransferase involved in cell wall biosynthesis